MKPATAASFIRKALEDATPEQLTALGSAGHSMSGAPNYPRTALNALRAALREVGIDPINDTQRYISARTYAGLRRQKTVPRNSAWVRDYEGIEAIRDVPVEVVRSADIEGQAVFWVLVAGPALDGDVAALFLGRWIRAGLPLPKGTT